MMPTRSIRNTFVTPLIGMPIAGLLGAVTLNAHSQDAVVSPLFSIAPSFSVTQTFTDNRLLSRDDRQYELITQISPGLHINRNFGRIKGKLDYSLNTNIYAGDTGSNNFQNSLNAALHVEAIENRAFIDASALISQQSISAFGVQSPDPALRTSNQSEVSSYNISPYVRGFIPGVLNYQARGNYSIARGGSFGAANSTVSGVSANISSDRSLARLGWTARVSREVVDFDRGRRTESDQINGGLTFAVNPELMFSLTGGREANNYLFSERTSSSIWGYAINWRPNERTRFGLEGERRFFGNSHSLVVEYRTPRTVWNYMDSRNISTGSPSDARVGVTVHDLLFAQFASIAPDPVQREMLVNAFLLSNGINPGALATGGFLTSAVSLQRRQALSFAMTGLRETLIVSAFKTESSALDSLAPRTDDLSGGGLIRQHGVSVNVAHRLTLDSALNFAISQLKSSATVGARTSDQRSLSASWTGRLGSRMNLALTARHVIFDSAATSYNESALTAGLTFQF